MYVDRPKRPEDFDVWFMDLPVWSRATPQQKALIIADEWLTLYEGKLRGPLSRQPKERWLEAFEAAGCFSALHTLQEISPGNLESTISARLYDEEPIPPVLYRHSVPAHRDRWSWTDNLDAARASMHPGEHIWVCRAPVAVFGRISAILRVLPGSEYRPEVFSEWIVDPGKVERYSTRSIVSRNTKNGAVRKKKRKK